jgi:hypothetical protein
MFKGCGEDMHTNWWAFSCIKKPCEDDKEEKELIIGMQQLVLWTIYKVSS